MGDVALLTDERVPGGVTFAFTERGGGVSEGPYRSLNLGSACGDDPGCVAENRRRALASIGAEGLLEHLVAPRQVHGDHVVVVRSAESEALESARPEAASGADAVVCTVPGVPVLMCFADCVPRVVVAPGAFAVIHSGWRGTMARIAAKAICALCDGAGCAPTDLLVYDGPHIGAADYEVSEDRAASVAGEFGPGVVSGERNLDLSAALAVTLREAGVSVESVAWCETSTASAVDRFFSYRAEGGTCGRHGALAVLLGSGEGEAALG